MILGGHVDTCHQMSLPVYTIDLISATLDSIAEGNDKPKAIESTG